MSTLRRDIIERDEEIDVKSIDSGIKNVWRWHWLEKEVNGVFLSELFRKVRTPGVAYCLVCRKEIFYATRGKVALEDHVKSKKHITSVKSVNGNTKMPGQSCQQKGTYGLHPMFSKSVVKPAENLPKPLTPLCDRVVTAEATILGFVAENSLSFASVPKLITLCKTLAVDKKSLDKLGMDRTSASYKMKYGLAKTIKEKVVLDLQTSYFSLNVDEATSENNNKVLAVLASYYSPQLKEVVVQHLDSIKVIRANAETLHSAVMNLFTTNTIPLENLISILLDSCSVMRGSKSGLETRLRIDCPHLLDVDGDSCHHVHLAAKALCKPFDKLVEKCFNDVFNDFRWSPDLREALSDICNLLSIKFTVPERYVSHRWLSVYDVTVDFLRLLDAYTLFYFAFLSGEERSRHLPVIMEIYLRRKVTDKGRECVKLVQHSLSQKNMTQDGTDRKKRIANVIFQHRKETKLICNFYSSVMPLLKSYVMLFQMKQPLIHKLHDKQLELFSEFVSCFLKPEVINKNKLSGRKLKKLDLDDVDNHLPEKRWFIGTKTVSLIECTKKHDPIQTTFRGSVKEAFIACGKVLQSKMPLNNQLLISLSAIDPVCVGHTSSLAALEKLPSYFPTVISEDLVDEFVKENRKFQCDPMLPKYCDEEERIDCWWAKVAETGRYPTLVKVVFAALSIFHGPQVESSFNIMGDIIDCRSTSMQISTYSDIQTVKYFLKSSKQSSLSIFQKSDFIHENVDPALCKNMRGAHKSYKNEKLEKRVEMERKRKESGASSVKLVTKRKAKELMHKAAKKARVEHSKKLAPLRSHTLPKVKKN